MPTWRMSAVAVLSAITLVGILFIVGYLTTSIPSVNSLVRSQTTFLYYADGHTELGTIAAQNRVSLDSLAQVSPAAQHAVLAAEDRNFYSEPGISLTGIGRALWNDVRGGSVQQGGSTITQQYAKNAYLTQQRTISRKFREVFIAIKLSRQQSKDQILLDYLNTIYFGRGAYGIETAARAYFGVPASQLSVSQAAMLAGLIRGPSIYDPAVNPRLSQERWHYVIGGMVAKHWLTSTEAAGLTFPKALTATQRNALGGPNGFVIEMAKAELAKDGFDEQRLNQGGYRVTLTVDARAQQAAINAERAVLGDRSTPLSGLAAVKPGDGAIVALYGGRDYTGHQPAAQVNLATSIARQAGSSFKPYTLAAALQQGIGLRTAFAGYSPMTIPGWGSNNDQVQNDNNEQCGRCDLIQATAQSVNTVYAQLVMKVGPDKVARLATAAGVRHPLPVHPSITLGTGGVSPLDQADGFATFAALGQHAAPYLVARVVDSHGHVVFATHPHTDAVFSAQVARDATYAMTQVVSYGTGTRAQLAAGRPAAGKTGTTSGNNDAWFVGFTPQLSAAVWMGNPKESQPLTNVPGYEQGVYGGTLPAEIWKQFMDAALAGQPAQQFQPPVFLGSTSAGLPSPTPSPSPSVTPSPAHSPSPHPSPTRSPRPSHSPSPLPSGRPTPSGSPLPGPTGAGSPSPSPT